MKKSTQPLLIILIFASFLLSIGCAKQGCLDPDASNYDAEADKDNGTCTFDGSIVFWFDLSTSDSLYYSGSDYLNYYVDGELIGTDSVQYYWNSAPNCGDEYSMTANKSLGSDKVKSFDYSIIDDLGYVIWAGTVEFDANQCWSYRLDW